MNTGFESLVNPPTPVAAADLESSRADRERIHHDVRMRQHIVWLMDQSAPESEVVRISELSLVDSVSPAEEQTDPDEDHDWEAG